MLRPFCFVAKRRVPPRDSPGSGERCRPFLSARVCPDRPLEIRGDAVLRMAPAIGPEHVQSLLRLAERREGSGEVAGRRGEIGVERVGLSEVRKSGAEVPAPLVENAEVLFRAGVV